MPFASDALPAGHGEQAAAPGCELKVPGPHKPQAEAALVAPARMLNQPGWHWPGQLEAFVPEPKRPTGQAAMFIVSEHIPDPQRAPVQFAWPEYAKKPGKQFWQVVGEVAAVLKDAVPAAQC